MVQVKEVLDPTIGDAQLNHSFEFFRNNGFALIGRQFRRWKVQDGRVCMNAGQWSGRIAHSHIDLDPSLRFPQVSGQQNTATLVFLILANGFRDAASPNPRSIDKATFPKAGRAWRLLRCIVSYAEKWKGGTRIVRLNTA
jgi:hypothetical protein